MNAALKNHSLSFPFRRIDCGTIMNGKGLVRLGASQAAIKDMK